MSEILLALHAFSSLTHHSSLIYYLELDLDVNPGRKVKTHQRIDRLRGRFQDVDQPLMGTHLELFPGIFIHVRRAQHRNDALLRRQRDRPQIEAPVRWAVSTIFWADWSSILWSKAFNLIRIF